MGTFESKDKIIIATLYVTNGLSGCLLCYDTVVAAGNS